MYICVYICVYIWYVYNSKFSECPSFHYLISVTVWLLCSSVCVIALDFWVPNSLMFVLCLKRAVFAFKAAVSSSSLYRLALGWEVQSVTDRILRLSQTSLRIHLATDLSSSQERFLKLVCVSQPSKASLCADSFLAASLGQCWILSLCDFSQSHGVRLASGCLTDQTLGSPPWGPTQGAGPGAGACGYVAVLMGEQDPQAGVCNA